ncbi:MAG: WYL domain-containing protein, partial [Oscillospiraceae bacterium]|nr:WYL domain-containing protein [Oscillospiraceae bacterium]
MSYERKTDRPGTVEVAIRTLECLRRETDHQHQIKQSELRELLREYYRSNAKARSNDIINALARGLNFDMDGTVLPEDEWRIVFNEFRRVYGSQYDESEEDEEEETDDAKRMSIRKLYYQQIFSYEEIDALIEGVLFSKTLDEETAKRIAEKIRSNLTSRHYTDNYREIHKVREPMPLNRAQLHENIAAIREALDNGKRISFRFNTYDRRGKLVPTGEPYVASPHYIVANGGHYYLIGGADNRRDANKPPKMLIWRIDLMSDVEVLKTARTARNKIENMPPEWTDSFQFSHLNMSYDKPETIRLRIRDAEGGEP